MSLYWGVGQASTSVIITVFELGFYSIYMYIQENLKNMGRVSHGGPVPPDFIEWPLNYPGMLF